MPVPLRVVDNVDKGLTAGHSPATIVSTSRPHVDSRTRPLDENPDVRFGENERWLIERLNSGFS
jgi:hypothetical protein